MQRHNLPTAAFEVFTDFALARQYIESVGYRVVVKVKYDFLQSCVFLSTGSCTEHISQNNTCM